MEKIKVLRIDPMEEPRTVEIENTLETLQETVGGIVQALYPWEDPVAVLCADDGKIKQFPPNRLLEDYDILVGTFLICGLGEENFASLTPELISKYREKFIYPELFVKKDGHILCIRAGSPNPIIPIT